MTEAEQHLHLPVTKHFHENPEAPYGFEKVGKSVVERYYCDHPEVKGPVLTEVCKCRSEEWAAQVVKAMNELRARESKK